MTPVVAVMSPAASILSVAAPSALSAFATVSVFPLSMLILPAVPVVLMSAVLTVRVPMARSVSLSTSLRLFAVPPILAIALPALPRVTSFVVASVSEEAVRALTCSRGRVLPSVISSAVPSIFAIALAVLRRLTSCVPSPLSTRTPARTFAPSICVAAPVVPSPSVSVPPAASTVAPPAARALDWSRLPVISRSLPVPPLPFTTASAAFCTRSPSILGVLTTQPF